jgi:hypothetical protein
MTLRRVVAVFAVLAAAAPGLYAYVPPPNRIHTAIADTNKADGRAQAIRLEFSMQIGERTGVATGELISHPTGLARLELVGGGGLLERHLLQGNERTATRNGVLLDDARAFLPPFFILQADSGVTLRAALTSFGIAVDSIGLAPCGDEDCLLIGDRDRQIPRPEPPSVAGLEAESGAAEPSPGIVFETGAGGGIELGGEVPDTAQTVWPRVWVETRTYEIRGFDDSLGSHIRLGPIVSFGKLRVPSWISVEEPGRVTARFDVTAAGQVVAPASAFSREWLFAIPDSSGTPAPPAPPTP